MANIVRRDEEEDDEELRQLQAEANAAVGLPPPAPRRRATAEPPPPTANPALTFHAFQERMMQLTDHKDQVLPAFMLSAAAGRLGMMIAMKREGRPWGRKEEELFAKDMGQVLYYLSSLCDQMPVSLQRIAEISLADKESAVIKKLHGRPEQGGNNP